MAKVINITEKFSAESPVIKIGDKEYEINDSLETVFKFEELAASGSNRGMLDALEMALGKDAAKDLKISKLPIAKFKALVIAVMAAMQDMTYEEAEARFRRQQ